MASGIDENVGEEDRGVEVKAADRLQRHFRRHGRRVAEIEEALRLGPQRPVFGKIAARLTHQPHGRDVMRNAAQGGNQAFFIAQAHPSRLPGHRSQGLV